MWKYINKNPRGRSVGDCAVRAVSLALGIDWEEAYILMADAGLQMGDLPNADSTWGSVLRQHGFYRKNIPNSCPQCYTIADFARDNPYGIFVLGTGTHVVTVIDGDIYDAWDSSNEIPQYYWELK